MTLIAIGTLDAQSTKSPRPSKPAPEPQITRIQADLTCPSELGVGVKTRRRFCDVLTGRDPEGGILVSVPPHRGPVTLSFELHNRHTYSEELVKSKRAFRQYTATIGVLTMDNTLVDRAVIQSDFRSATDLYRIGEYYDTPEETLAKLGIEPNRKPGQVGFTFHA